MAKKQAPPPALRLEWRSPRELADNPRNWRRHPEAQVAALADVIAEVARAGACLYNERTGRLIDGRARRKVAIDQGTDKVPVLVGSWSEQDEAKIQPGDLVYDPFLGSGTTLIAAHRLGRRCYGCEIEPRYADVVLRRACAEGLTCKRADL